jgi:hypothetical protein
MPNTLTISSTQLQENSVKTYKDNYDRCLRLALSTRTLNEDESPIIKPMDIVDDWFSTQKLKKAGTANIQRSAILWALKTDQPPGWEDACKRLNSTSRVSRRDAKNADREIISDKRTRVCGRVIPEEDLRLLINRLIDMRSWGGPTQWFLIAGVASGARPGEWPEARWADEDKTILRIHTSKGKVRNAWDKIPAMTFDEVDTENETDKLWKRPDVSEDPRKNSENDDLWNAIDFERRISSFDLSEDELTELRSNRAKNGVALFRDVAIEPQYRTYVKLHMDSVQSVISAKQRLYPNSSVAAIFGKHYYSKSRHCVWRACVTIFEDEDKLYSLADTRQTFSANRKALNGRESAAAELGHSITTSKDHYAPARKAWTKYKQMDEQALSVVPVQVSLPAQVC